MKIKKSINVIKIFLIDIIFRSKYNNETKKLLKNITIKEFNSSDKNNKYYIIQRKAYVGLFSYVQTSLAHIGYAIAKGYIPIIDMKNHSNTYLENDKIGKENSWEYYFQQPYNFSLDDIKNKKNVIKSSKIFFPTLPAYGNLNDYYINNYWYVIFNNYFRLNKKTEEYCNNEYREISNKGKILGVLCRGTDYIIKKPFNHPIQPEIDNVIKKIKDCIIEWKCDYIYLATDEKKTLNRFENEFPSRILTNKRMYYDNHDYSNMYITEATHNRDNDKYLNGLEYLSSIMILSKCNCLISGITSGSLAAIYINGGKYENKYIFNLGKYGIDD